MKKRESLKNVTAHKEALYEGALYGFFFIIIELCYADAAYAGAMSDVLCLIVGWFNGNLGAGLATIAISAVGIGAIFGKMTWGLALTVGVGVSVMFSATTLISTVFEVSSPC